MKRYFASRSFALTVTLIVNFGLWFLILSMITSAFKSFGDCDRTYQIEKYKIQGNWFCPTEESRLSDFTKTADKRSLKRK